MLVGLLRCVGCLFKPSPCSEGTGIPKSISVTPATRVSVAADRSGSVKTAGRAVIDTTSSCSTTTSSTVRSCGAEECFCQPMTGRFSFSVCHEVPRRWLRDARLLSWNLRNGNPRGAPHRCKTLRKSQLRGVDEPWPATSRHSVTRYCLKR
jgi:hypothetical protein